MCVGKGRIADAQYFSTRFKQVDVIELPVNPKR